MRVFISWSGEPSRSIAKALNGWLKLVVQHADTWVSDDEIKSGQRWSDQIAKSLDATDFGIICVTHSNQHAPWLTFEAGALAKRLEVARVVPLYINTTSSEVTGPLAEFQGQRLDKDGMRQLVHDVREACESPIAAVSVDALFDAMWPSFEASVTEAINKETSREEPPRSTQDMLAELIDRARRIDRNTAGEVDRQREELAVGAYFDDQGRKLLAVLRDQGLDDEEIWRICSESDVAAIKRAAANSSDDLWLQWLVMRPGVEQIGVFAATAMLLSKSRTGDLYFWAKVQGVDPATLPGAP
jgi:hypothetical protein